MKRALAYYARSSIAQVKIAAPLDMRSAARALYPGSSRQARRLQRLWLHCYRRAPGPRVPVGAFTEAENRERSRQGWPLQHGPGKPPALAKNQDEPPAPRAHRRERGA